MFRTTNDIYNSFGCFINYLTGSDGKESACNAADPGSIPELGRSPVGRNGNPFWYFFAWRSPWTEEHGRLQFMGTEQTRLSN